MSQELMKEELEFAIEDEETSYSTEEIVEDDDSGLADRSGIDFDSMGINPLDPTQAKPGSEDKVLMLSARYAAGLPLWHGNDRYDHAPGQSTISGFSGLKFDA
jgi:hypothetical protein